MTVQLDTLDHRLLRLLDEDASMSAADLAIMLNSEEAHVASRIQVLRSLVLLNGTKQSLIGNK